MKDSNKKFEGFAHNLIAESLRKWAEHSKFVSAKLEKKLSMSAKIAATPQTGRERR